VLDFDAHTDWLRLEVCLDEVLRFLSAFTDRWNITAESLFIAFSGRAGFHITIPATMLGDVASPQLTTAYKHWASALKDALGLITLDAPSRQTPEWWWQRISATLGALPPAVQDRDAFALSLRRVGIYSRRRMIRREGSLHPDSGLYKIPLLPHELMQGVTAIRAQAAQPRVLPARLAPAPHPGMAAHLRRLLREITAQQEQCRRKITHTRDDDHRTDPVVVDGVPDEMLSLAAETPLCMRRLLEKPPADGGSNMPLMTLAAYCRAQGVPLESATAIARRWLLYGVASPGMVREREASARSVVKAAYDHRYAFARRFVVPLHLVSDEECAACPLRAPCYGMSR
jgi:hypothetical protein